MFEVLVVDGAWELVGTDGAVGAAGWGGNHFLGIDGVFLQRN